MTIVKSFGLIPQKRGVLEHMKTHWNIFMAFFRSGMLGYGGGPGAIPLIHKEVVSNYKFMSDEEFGDTLAIANTLPGPIATKLAGYIGYRKLGIWGMFNALVATCLPTIILINILLVSLSSIKKFDWVQGMTAAVVPVVGMMMAVLTWEFFNKARKGLGWKVTVPMCIVLIFLMQVIHLHPAIVIAGLFGLAIMRKDKATNHVEQGEGKVS